MKIRPVIEAKLSTKQRKKLSSGSFCGPNRSFPVPDCKHVKAGLSLLGRYKGPGDKNKIRACIYRKAKSMSCFKGKDSDLGMLVSDIMELEVLYYDGVVCNDDLFLMAVDIAEAMGVDDHYLSFLSDLFHHDHGDLALKMLRNHIGRAS